METVVLVVHLILALCIIVLVLMQRSEGGGLTGTTSGGAGNFASPKSTANVLTRATAICFTLFIVTSMTLAIMANNRTSTSDILQKLEAPAAEAAAPADAGKDAQKADQTEQKSDEKPKAPVPGAQ